MDGPDLYALVYSSRAVVPFSDGDLEGVLESARAFNEGVGVTGFLAYERPNDDRPGTFVQRIEGPRRAVLDVFETRVLRSSRHTDVEIKVEGPITAREFEGWSMAFDVGRAHSRMAGRGDEH